MRTVVNAGARLTALFFIFLAGCRPEIQPASPNVVASVGTNAITRDELIRAMDQRARSLGRDAGLSADIKQAVLDELIREKVLLTKARAAGIENDPELIRRWERMVVAKYEAAHKPDVNKLRGPTTAEIADFYHKNLAEYRRPKRIRVGLIHIKGTIKATEEKRADLRARAEKILNLAQAPDADFSALARMHSEDRTTRYSGGDAGWMERSQVPTWWPPELTDASFQLESPGSFAPLIEASGSYYVVKLVDLQPAGERPLTEVRERIAHHLKEQQRIANEERFYAEQKAGVNVEINQASLQAVSLPAPAVARGPGAPPSLPSN